MKTTLRKLSGAMLLGGAVLATSLACAAPQLQSNSELTYDGLQRLERSSMDMAWVKLDINLSSYTKIMVVPAQMSFKAVRNPGLRSNATEFPLSEHQKQTLRDTLTSVFVEELGKLKHYQVVTQPGPDVLQVQGAILDVVSHVPPQQAGRGGTILRDIGEATLVVELRDSMSNEILARAVDHRTVSASRPMKSTSINNLAEVRFAARHWASMLGKRLEQFSSL